MRFDWTELRYLQGEKLLYIVPHESGDYWILNYTPQAQYGHAWDAHPTLLDCRGTVIRADGSVVAKPFRKFFNLGERPDTTMEYVERTYANTHSYNETADKLDGSMITLWRDDAGGINFATRGSFTSPQAQMALRYWMVHHHESAALLDASKTYLFELCGPDNRIVVRYPENSLTMIGLVDTETGREHSYFDVGQEADRLDVPCVNHAPSGDWFDLPESRIPNFEGWVVFWDMYQVRIKIKTAEYVRLHRIIAGLSEHTIWETLATGGDPETLRSQIPEELHAWFDGVEGDLCQRFMHLSTLVQEAMWHLSGRGLMAKDREARKDAAHVIMTDYPEHLRAAIFRALDDKPYDNILWKQLEPKAVPIFKDAEG
jgi:RNA ligase